ncbi:MAG: hypothetical protein ACR2RE_03530 [Geminicoccaceae bacterium]
MHAAFRLIITSSLIAVAISGCLPGGDQEASGTGAGQAAPANDPPTSDPASESVELGLNDVSILLPPPTTADDPVLAITDLAFKGSSFWPDDAFQQFKATASSDAGAVAEADDPIAPRGSRIDIRAFDDKAVWHIASIRVDPGAPGLAPEIAAAFGQTPQIRLVLQPVTGNNEVHDVAAHMIYSFVSGFEPPEPGCSLPRFKPDEERFRQIVDDIVAMKAKLAAGDFGGDAIDTDGPLSIHPAAAATVSPATRSAFLDALKDFLNRHLDPAKLRAMAIMGLPGRDIPEPWLFLAMAPNRETGRFSPVPSPALAQDSLRFTQMLDARRGAAVAPAVRVNNLNPITCRFEVPANPLGLEPPENPDGVSTAELFPSGDPERMREIIDIIADPTQAHFFNTDCVSCHTETRREMDLLGTDRIDAAVDPSVLPTELWNVRNFGWFPSFLNGGVFATATRRTATETEEVVDAVNALLAAR